MPELKTRPITDQDWLIFSKYWFQKQPGYAERIFGRGALISSVHPEGHLNVIYGQMDQVFWWFKELDYPTGWKDAFNLLKTYDWKNEYVVIFHDLRNADDGDYVRLVYGVVSNTPLVEGS